MQTAVKPDRQNSVIPLPSKMVAPRVFRFLTAVKGNEDSGNEIAVVLIQIALPRPQAPLCFIGRERASSEAGQQVRPRDKAVMLNLHYCIPGSPSWPVLELMTRLLRTQGEGTGEKAITKE